jgi:hypothetical protein
MKKVLIGSGLVTAVGAVALVAWLEWVGRTIEEPRF